MDSTPPLLQAKTRSRSSIESEKHLAHCRVFLHVQVIYVQVLSARRHLVGPPTPFL